MVQIDRGGAEAEGAETDSLRERTAVLFTRPTPLEPMRSFTASLKAALDGRGPDEIWIKHEDLMGAGFGGNKLRNAEVYVAEARRMGADTLVAFGRRQANHCRLVAAAAARAGFRCELVFNGPAPRDPGLNARLCESYGAVIHYSADETTEARDHLTDGLCRDLRDGGRRPYLSEPGASGPIGALGQVLAGIEVAAQFRDAGIAPDYIFTGVATGGTYAGLKVGLWLSRCPTTVIGVPTHLALVPSDAEFRAHVAELTQQLRDRWVPEACGPGWSDDVVLDDLTAWRSFGTSTPEAREAAAMLAASEAVLADQTYSARSLSGLVAWARDGRLNSKCVVFWHAGGLPAAIEETLVPAASGIH